VSKIMSDNKIYKTTTKDIGVSVEPFYLDKESVPDENHYVWGYQVQIENYGNKTVQLQRRHWIITDGNGQKHEVEGEGVVGNSQSSNLVRLMSTQVVPHFVHLLVLWLEVIKCK